MPHSISTSVHYLGRRAGSHFSIPGVKQSTSSSLASRRVSMARLWATLNTLICNGTFDCFTWIIG